MKKQSKKNFSFNQKYLEYNVDGHLLIGRLLKHFLFWIWILEILQPVLAGRPGTSSVHTIS